MYTNASSTSDSFTIFILAAFALYLPRKSPYFVFRFMIHDFSEVKQIETEITLEVFISLSILLQSARRKLLDSIDQEVVSYHETSDFI